MRSLNAVSLLSLFVAALGLGACAAPSDDGSDGQTQDVTGGSTSIESPVVFLFDSAADGVAPKCAGAMLADKFAVTVTACAKPGLIVGHAADKDGHGARARVAKVHRPPTAESDIAVVELDAPLVGTHALITHMPLRAGYSVNAFAAAEGKGLFSPDKNEASSIPGAIVEETSTHGVLVPVKGTEICDGDIGAPVCSSTGGKLTGMDLYGTCGLSGLVVGRAFAAAPSTPAGGKPPACSGGAWRVAQLGQHAEFLKTFAPKAFQPWFIDQPLVRNYPYYAPDGLWGYKTKGDVKACTIDAASLAPLALGAASPKLTAKVSFAGMDKNATAFGRFGIAPKGDPTTMRWLPARALGAATGVAFDATFEGIVDAAAAGEYVVAFRASANGGESWTPCDTDGMANGYSLEKTLFLSVIDPSAPPPVVPPPVVPTPTPTPTTPTMPTTPTTTPQDTLPGPSGSDGTYSDPPATEGEATDGEPNEDLSGDPAPAMPKKKARASEQGCSMSSAPTGGLGGSSPLPILGVALGLAALSRRRRAQGL